jgi:hypothetical protein
MTTGWAGSSSASALSGPTVPSSSANRRYLEVQAHTPSGASHSRAWLESGTKAQLRATLQDPQTVDRVHRAIAKMAQSLEDNDFR